ncbi:MAG: dihydropteroate synthase [Deltaproteobacteria bacterium]
MKRQAPLVMGILNVTPDSFSDGGRFLSLEKSLEQARKLMNEGADIVDIGGESTRPGAGEVSLEEEMNRVLPVIEALRKETDVTLSIDTTKYEVAKAAVELGVSIINDVSGGQDIRLVELLNQNPKVQLILMHRKGDPKTMQLNPQYPLGVVSEVKSVLEKKIRQFKEAGVDPSRLWIDPGIGFGKNLNHNLDLLRHLDVFEGIGGRVVIGTSRKSFLSGVLPKSENQIEERTEGTLTTQLWAYRLGASVFRVHEVAPLKRALTTWDAIEYGRF